MSKRIVITGAGSGLGRAMARTFAAAGHRLVLLGRAKAKLDALAAELGSGALPIVCDVADVATIDRTFEMLAADGAIDVLVNNAGTFRPSTLADASLELIRETISTNLLGPIFCSRAALPLLGPGSLIINVSSETVVVPVAMLSIYQSSKAGLERFAASLKQELVPAGVRVMTVRAGKMFEPGMAMPFDPELAERFAAANRRIGVDNAAAGISNYASAAGIIASLLDLPDDITIPEITLEGRRAPTAAQTRG